MTKTVAKYTESHDRLTLNVNFANGEHIRLNISRNRTSASSKNMILAHVFRPLAAAMMKLQPADNGSYINQMNRVKSFIERYDSAEAALNNISKI